MIIRITLENQTNEEIFKEFLIENSNVIISYLKEINAEWQKFNKKK